MMTGDANESSLLRILTNTQNARSLADVLEVAFDAVIVYDPDERILYWNPAAEQMFGWTSQEALGKTPAELFGPVNSPQEKENQKQRQLSLARGETLRGEQHPCRKDGSVMWVQYIARAVFDTEGKLSRYLTVYQDLSTRAQMHQKEEQSEHNHQPFNEMLSSIYDNAPFLMGIAELDGNEIRTIASNRLVAEFFDTNAANLSGKSGSGLGNRQDYEQLWLANYRRSQTEGAPVQFEYEHPRQTGPRWLHATVAFIGNSSSGMPRFSFVAEDVTERKQIEKALGLENQRFMQFVNSNIVGILIGDAHGRVLLANDYYLRILGVTRQDFVEGKVDWKKFTPPEWLPADEKAVQQLQERGVCEPYEKEYVRADGTRVPVFIADAMFPGPGGEIAAFVLDITERKQAEKALLENEKQLQLLNETLEQKVQEKTTELQRLASDLTKAEQRERHRISHILHDDLQQRVYAMQMQLKFLRAGLMGIDQAAWQELADLETQLGEVLEITRHLSIDLSPPILRDEGLSHAVNWLAGQMWERYGLAIELHADGPFAIAEEELHVLLFNCIRELLFNVVKHAQASRAEVTLQWTEGALEIEVSDDGKGFAINISDSQASAELPADGALPANFGLSTIRHQLSLIDGRIEIRSTPESGTRIKMIVPLTKEQRNQE
jgi:PAS domain S-box-containing protein